MSLPWGGIGVRGSSAPHITEAYSRTFASGASNNSRDRRCASRVTLAVPTIHTLFSIDAIDGVFNFPDARHRLSTKSEYQVSKSGKFSERKFVCAPHRLPSSPISPDQQPPADAAHLCGKLGILHTRASLYPHHHATGKLARLKLSSCSRLGLCQGR